MTSKAGIPITVARVLTSNMRRDRITDADGLRGCITIRWGELFYGPRSVDPPSVLADARIYKLGAQCTHLAIHRHG